MKKPNKSKMVWNTHLTRKKAIELYRSGWWEGKTAEEIVRFQLFEERSCMPFSKFHEAIEKVLKRPVYTHEFGLNWEGLQQEYLGKRNKPTIEDILDLFPKDKPLIVIVK